MCCLRGGQAAEKVQMECWVEWWCGQEGELTTAADRCRGFGCGPAPPGGCPTKASFPSGLTSEVWGIQHLHEPCNIIPRAYTISQGFCPDEMRGWM